MSKQQLVGKSNRKAPQGVPASTANLLVFPFSKASKTYDIGSYNPGQTGNQLQTAEVSSYIRDLENVFIHHHRDQICSLIVAVLSFLLLVALATVGGVFIATLESKTGLLVGWIVLLVVLLALFLTMIRRYIVLCHHEEADASQVTKNHNHHISGRGLAWKLPANYHRWVELHITHPTVHHVPAPVVHVVHQPQVQHVQHVVRSTPVVQHQVQPQYVQHVQHQPHHHVIHQQHQPQYVVQNPQHVISGSPTRLATSTVGVPLNVSTGLASPTRVGGAGIQLTNLGTSVINPNVALNVGGASPTRAR